MRALRFIGALLAAVLVHVAGVHLWPDFTRAVDVFLVLTVFIAMGGNLLAGLGCGLLAGLVLDALSGGPYGLYGFADTLVGYWTAFASQRLVIQRWSGVLLLFALAAVAQQAILIGLGAFLLTGPLPTEVAWPLIKTGTTAVLGLALFTGRRRLQGRIETWRRNRSSKLR
jgi:rod shape-determining protein MreD